MTEEDVPQRVVAVAVPVLAGVGGVLHEILTVGGQVMVTCPCINAKGAKASQTAKIHLGTPLLEVFPYGLEPWK